MFKESLSVLGGFTGSIKAYANIAIIVVVLSFAGAAYWKYRATIKEVETLHNEKIQLEKEKTQLSTANEANQTFIQKMQEDLNKKEKVVTDFRIQKARDDKKLSDLSKIIVTYDTFQDGPIAKVLKDAIIGVQTETKENQ